MSAMSKAIESLGAHCAPILNANGTPLLVCPPTWKGPLIERKEIPGAATCGPQSTGMPVISMPLSGRGKRWYRSGGKTLELHTGTPTFDIYGATYERDHGRWEGDPGESITLRLHPAAVRYYLRENAHGFDLETRYNIRDDLFRKTLHSLATEMQNGMPNGTLFTEGLSTMVIGWLSTHYAKKPLPGMPRQCGLSLAQRAAVRELVESVIDSTLTVERMATEAGLSPYYFSKLFNVSFGLSPHQYVLERRIDRATTMLCSSPRLSIAEIAQAVGFSNQAHFADTFKRSTGRTPRAYQQEKFLSR